MHSVVNILLIAISILTAQKMSMDLQAEKVVRLLQNQDTTMVALKSYNKKEQLRLFNLQKDLLVLYIILMKIHLLKHLVAEDIISENHL